MNNNNNNNDDPAFAVGFLIGKVLISILMAWLITTYSLPLWLAALLIFMA